MEFGKDHVAEIEVRPVYGEILPSFSMATFGCGRLMGCFSGWSQCSPLSFHWSVALTGGFKVLAAAICGEGTFANKLIP